MFDNTVQPSLTDMALLCECQASGFEEVISFLFSKI